MEMIKSAEFVEQYKQGKVPAATLVKMAAFKDELEKAFSEGRLDELKKIATLFGANGILLPEKVPSFLSRAGTAIGKAFTNDKTWQLIGMGVVGAAMATFSELVKGLEGKILDWSTDQKKPKMFEDMLETHPELRDFPMDRLKLYFEALVHFAPSMAENPLAAGAYIKQALKYDHVAQGPLPQSVQELSMIEKTRQQAKGENPGNSFMKAVMTPMGAPFKISND